MGLFRAAIHPSMPAFGNLSGRTLSLCTNAAQLD